MWISDISGFNLINLAQMDALFVSRKNERFTVEAKASGGRTYILGEFKSIEEAEKGLSNLRRDLVKNDPLFRRFYGIPETRALNQEELDKLAEIVLGPGGSKTKMPIHHQVRLLQAHLIAVNEKG